MYVTLHNIPDLLSLIIVTKIWCFSSVGVGISKEALDRAHTHYIVLKKGMDQWIAGGDLGSAAKGSAVGLEVAGSGLGICRFSFPSSPCHV